MRRASNNEFVYSTICNLLWYCSRDVITFDDMGFRFNLQIEEIKKLPLVNWIKSWLEKS